MTKLSFIALAAGICLSCSDEPTTISQKPPAYYNFFKEYSLEPESATLEASNLALERVGSEQCANAQGVVLCAQANWMAFTIEVRNESEEIIQVDWNRARYVDENGSEHPINPKGEGMISNKVERVIPGTAIRRTVDAIGKRQLRGSGEYAYVGYEPLLPWTHGEDPASTKRVVEAIFAKRVPVLLKLPISVAGGEKTFVWIFRLTNQQFRVL